MGSHGGSLDEIRCVLHLPLTLIITHLKYVPRRCSQEAAKPDPDARWRAEQPELERSYLFVFRPLLGMPYRSLRCVSVFAFISHVSVATVVSLYEG